METIEKQTYRGWIIQEEIEPWAIDRGWKFRYGRGEGELAYTAETLEEAKDEITERVIGDLHKEIASKKCRISELEKVKDASEKLLLALRDKCILIDERIELHKALMETYKK